MVRIKNAITQYFVAEVPTAGTDPVWLELANFITEVNDNTDETTEDSAYYSGDGTTTTEVTQVKGGYDFVGFYDASDAAQAMIAGKKYQIGSARRIMFAQKLSDATELAGEATVSAIVATGGAAEDYEPFQCTIQWNEIPTTPATPLPAGLPPVPTP